MSPCHLVTHCHLFGDIDDISVISDIDDISVNENILSRFLVPFLYFPIDKLPRLV